MAISERIELLGKGLYNGEIPDILTLKAIPTASELDYVGGEDFVATMLDVIFPKAIEEKCDFHKLLEIDFYWICRALRILNYGPYHTTNAIFCKDCGMSRGEYQVDLRSIEVKPLPPKFDNCIKISKDEFIEFDGDITLKLPTIQEVINMSKDNLFMLPNGTRDSDLARIAYTVKSIKNDSNFPPADAKYKIQNNLTTADYHILNGVVSELTNYGLRAGGSTVCPKCGSGEATFIALVDDRFFRPTLGNLRSWKADRRAENASRPTTGDDKG